MTGVRVTHIGGPTTLIEIGGLRLLTDPTFDPPGRRYAFGWGTSSRKTAGPAFPAAELPPVDAVLLTHDHHGDNLDDAGRALLPGAGTVLTTPAGARRLGGNARGLGPWDTWKLTSAEPGGTTVEVTATPARHGPPLSRPVVGEVTGFALSWPGQLHGVLWISGDTVVFDGVREVGRRLTVGTALLHLGGVRFPVTGPLRYTMTAAGAVEVCRLLRPRTVVPVHYEGWSHFREGRTAAERTLAGAPAGIRDVFRWLPRGTATELSV
ncbi:MBL fold metallo-hydrolase [Streptomyces griseiscabiei]|uniref:MBL fold metallo-hydrolase n=1 Tax=Streptomyces griseiscabiei TaxID=2993540 RepID=A0ABU4L4Q4_9ACTN|nr:MBL fold metallo-hydrolase [Streptomyces griseiscabiei]MBZ3905640.1 MBL fold metallo-hydrolase [Streptomyces griseiscabiei]MDX2910732.1 MBL fold metallo-hydrolase [Streptomyces griseiscabiei]